MKVKEARNLLSGYEGDELHHKANELYQTETDYRIKLRSKGKLP